MSNLGVKLVLTPVLIGVATVAARRWGPSVGGWFAGLPLTSGPISLFLAMEQGRAFARKAAEGTLLGLVGVAAFCFAYCQMMNLLPPWATALVSVGAFLVVTVVASFFSVGLAVAIALLTSILGLALVAMGPSPAQSSNASRPRWDLPLRMVAATLLVLAITTGAAALGPRWSGLLSPFPVFACVMAVFAHHASGPSAVHRLLRGIVIGSFAFASFFVVLALTLEKASILLAYGLAAVVALGVNGLSLFALLRERAGRS